MTFWIIACALTLAAGPPASAKPAAKQVAEQKPAATTQADQADKDQQAEIDALRAEGLKHLDRGELAEAIKVLGQARAKGADDPATRIALGRAYLAREMYQQALIEFSEVLKRDPNQVAANLGRADSLIGLGDARKAIGPAKLMTEIEPGMARAWLTLGRAYLHPQVADYPKAQAAFRQALKLTPDSRDAAVNLARALSFAKKVEQAIDVLQKLHRKRPGDIPIVITLAESYYAIRKLDRAEKLINEALTAEPDNKDAIRVRDQIHARQAYDFWVPVVAIIAFPLLFLLIRWMKKGRVPKVAG